MLGNLIQATNRAGQVREFAYDELDRVRKENWLDIGSEVYAAHWQFDLAGRLVRQYDDNSEYLYTYDEWDRVIAKSCEGSEQVNYAFTHDHLNLTTTRTDTVNSTVGTVMISRDDLERVSRITDDLLGAQVDFAWDMQGNFTEVSRRQTSISTPQIVSRYDYDELDRLTSLIHDDGSNPITHSLGLDLASQITSWNSSEDKKVQRIQRSQ